MKRSRLARVSRPPIGLLLAAFSLSVVPPAGADLHPEESQPSGTDSTYQSVNAVLGAPGPVSASKDNPTQVPVSFADITVNAALNDDPLGYCFYSGGGNGQQVFEPTVKTKAQCPIPPNDKWERLAGGAYGAQDVYLTGNPE
jgi:hypothetical protein